jgi:hypothetical protein
MILFQNGKKYQECKYDLKDQIETDILKNSKTIFGENTIYVYARGKLGPVASDEISPAGFLFELSDKHNPRLHLVEVGISRYDFHSHIFPRITKLIVMLKDVEARSKLVDRFFSLSISSEDLRDKLENYVDDRSIHELIEDISESSINILLIIDGQKKEVFEASVAYPDTWIKMIRVFFLKKFVHEEESIYCLNRGFKNRSQTKVDPIAKLNQREDILHSEEFNSAKNDLFARESELAIPSTRKASLTKISGKTEGFFAVTLTGWEIASPKEHEPYRVRLETGETFRTSPVQLITETDDGVCIVTKNSVYQLKVFV